MHSIVVLDRRWRYHDEVDIKKVVNWMCNEKIEILAESDDVEIGSHRKRFKMPMVVRLMHWPQSGQGRMITCENIPFSDKAVYDRDRNQCQYYHYDDKGHKFIHTCHEEERTLDHLVPRSKGGKRTFLNSVCCCQSCNVRKGNGTPEEAGLELIRRPFIPKAKVGEFLVMRFTYNPSKIAHKYYMEKVLGKTIAS